MFPKHVFYDGFVAAEPWLSRPPGAKPRILQGFLQFLLGESLPGGLREISGGSPEAPEAARRLPGGPGGRK